MLIYTHGLIKVSTKDIARESEVAQGSIFLHFSNKENLLNIIINEGIQNLEIDIDEAVNPNLNREAFLLGLIDVISNHENILSRIYKDYPYLSESQKKNVDHLETKIKNLLFDNLRGSEGRKISIVDSFILIDSFVAQLKVNLLEKGVYTEFSSILRQRRGKMTKLYKTLFE